MDIFNNIFKGDKVIWAIYITLCLISVIEVFSAASTLTYRSANHWIPITQHTIYMVLGLIIVVLVHNIPYNYFKLVPLFLLPVSIVLLVVVMFQPQVNGASRYLSFLGINFQPSEFAKMAVVMLTANILSVSQGGEYAKPIAFKLIMVGTIFCCALIAPENLSTALLLFGTVYMMMFVGRVSWKTLIATAAVIICMGALFLAFLRFTPDPVLDSIPMGHRFTTWKHRGADFGGERVPAAKFDIDGDGQVAHARIAIASSNIIGKGPGNSVERDFLSQAYSDFIYAIIIEELGLGGGFVVLLLYVFLLWRIGKLAKKCDKAYPLFLLIGVGLLLATQAMFNMMVAVGLGPVTGQPLPLISRGGTSIIINSSYIGMVLSISRFISASEEQKHLESLDDTAKELVESEAQTAEAPKEKILNIDDELV